MNDNKQKSNWREYVVSAEYKMFPESEHVGIGMYVYGDDEKWKRLRDYYYCSIEKELRIVDKEFER